MKIVTPKIVIVGSLNMDIVVSTERLPAIGETLTGKSIHYISGGKGANQAVGCARLDADVQMIGAVGNDEFGKTIVAAMQRDNVQMGCVEIVDHLPTGVASITKTNDDNSIIIVPGANAYMTADIVNKYADIIQQADLLLVQLEIPLDGVHKALQLARAANVTTILNPAPVQQLSDELISLADYITPNEIELAQLGGQLGDVATEDWVANMKLWNERYNQKVVLTRGKDGAAILIDGELHVVQAPKVEVVDTTGAGDCLNAAFGYGIASGLNELDALSLAVKAASLSVGRFGAQAGMPTLDEL